MGILLRLSGKNSGPFRTAVCLFAMLTVSHTAMAQGGAPSRPELREKVGRIIQNVLAETGVPSASVAVVENARTVYVQAYGSANVSPRIAARAGMRYSIGSISKQFTATLIMMLAEEGKLSLDDPVSRFLPNLTRAGEVTVRQLLSHTSGYPDYWPQDYVPAMMLQPAGSEAILDEWARKPLDFDPGTQWQYSNTNYVIAGSIAERVSGKPLWELLQTRIFLPLGMRRVANVDQEKLGPDDAAGHLRYALGPPRLAPKEGKGWLFAAAELAMPVEELATWDIAFMSRTLLKPASYAEMEGEVKLKSGKGTGYGLGMDVGQRSGHRMLSHSGEVSGYTANNIVFPDDRDAVAVLTNMDSSYAAGEIARQVAALLVGSEDPDASGEENRMRAIFEGFQHGKIERSLFTADANDYFSPQAMRDFAQSLSPLGVPERFTESSSEMRGGMTGRVFTVTFAKRTLAVSTYEMPDGKIEQYQVVQRR